MLALRRFGNTEEKQDIQLSDVLKAAAHNTSRSERSVIKKAYHLAEDMHKFQKRLSGEPYIIHPLNVALLLAEMGMRYETISAALLHDVIEDTGITREYLTQEFGETIAHLVDGVTKISALKSQSAEIKQAVNIRKMILATVQDPRVIIIKLADKLHNMRTLGYMQEKSPEKAVRIGNEVIEIYAPLAGRLGMYSIKSELEDLALYYTNREAYQHIKKLIAEKREAREKRLNMLRSILNEKLKENKIKAEVRGRSKHFFSIYMKMKEKNKSLTDIFDLTGIRILVQSEQDCYGALGIVHTVFKPLEGRFKDYISVPKSNGYQSLHTSVVGPDGHMLEVQIRTYEMHRTAQNGIAAHWAYKEKTAEAEKSSREIEILQHIAELEESGEDAGIFLQELKDSLTSDEVYVFTPKGEIINMPKGSTLLDFAFRIHTDLGIHCQGAKIDGKLVSIRSILRSGQRIQIITNPGVKPSPDWLSFLKTAHARAKLRAWLRKEGMELHSSPKPAVTFSETVKVVPTPSKPKKKTPEAQVLFGGESNIKIKLAGCCSPVGGDAIVGYISKNHGLSVHKKECPSVTLLAQEPGGSDRIVPVSWSDEFGSFPAYILVTGADRPNLLAELTMAIAETGANILEVRANTDKQKGIRDIFRVEVDSRGHLKQVLEGLKKVQGIRSAKRVSSV